MKRTRLTIWGGVTVLAVVTLFACTAKQLNGQDCLKNFDCESDRCVAHFCVEPPSSPTTTTDTGVLDTGPADTGAADADGGSDTMAETASEASSD